jgi:uncharacterized protein (UPF0335 family)
MEPCSQKERIERLEGAVGKIGGEVSQIAADVNIIKVQIQPFIEMVGGHDRALRGSNGDIGLNAKVANAVEAMGDLTLALRGQGNEAGLITDILSLKKWMAELRDERKWLTRLVIGIVLAEIGGLLFVLLK